MSKNEKTFFTILFSILALAIAYTLINSAGLIYSADRPESVEHNCDTIHNIYVQAYDDWNYNKFVNYKEQTLYNFGFPRYSKKEVWNGTWIVDEDFIREYIKRFSADEFIGVFNSYISNSAYKDLPEETAAVLSKHISDVESLLFNMPDIFETGTIDPANDTAIIMTSNTTNIKGRFNSGYDNHITEDYAEQTRDTYEYNGYEVVHVYGKDYSQGAYGWKNGKFIDIKPYFYQVDYYSLIIDGSIVADKKESVSSFKSCRWLAADGKKYYELIKDNGLVYFTEDSRDIYKK